ncbi:hypothetical protein RERY_00680 [Rhodococcus erythropolis]|nr:hypothetical protein RERY_00680 [Rhodococcus erythropolis]
MAVHCALLGKRAEATPPEIPDSANIPGGANQFGFKVDFYLSLRVLNGSTATPKRYAHILLAGEFSE